MYGYKLVEIKLDALGNKETAIIECNKVREAYPVKDIISKIQSGMDIKNAIIYKNELRCLSKATHFIDLTAQQINEWTVIEYLGNKYWRCECSCGVVRAVHAGSLLNNRTQSCGNHDRLERRELTGQTFGDWFVKSYAGSKRWNCICTRCGQSKKILTDSLYYERDTKCICNPDKHSYNFKDLTGLIFGNWMVLSLAETSQRGTYWDCICACSPTVIRKVHSYSLTSGRSTSCGCLICVSKQEKVISDWLKSKGFTVIRNSRNIIPPKELDIYVPDKQLAIEYNGIRWHTDVAKSKYYHLDKTKQCNNKGIFLLHIFDYEWRNINKQKLFFDLISKYLNINQTVINSDSTIVKVVSINDAREFINVNHINGWIYADYCLGLYYNNELITIMTFKTYQNTVAYDIELVQFCNKVGIIVSNGIEKLFNEYIKDNTDKNIVTYCDITKFDSKIYERLNMKLSAYVEPSYIYTNGSYNSIIHRDECTKEKLLQKGWGTPDMTEEQIMTSQGFSRVYDCGMLEYVYLSNKGE